MWKTFHTESPKSISNFVEMCGKKFLVNLFKIFCIFSISSFFFKFFWKIQIFLKLSQTFCTLFSKRFKNFYKESSGFSKISSWFSKLDQNFSKSLLKFSVSFFKIFIKYLQNLQKLLYGEYHTNRGVTDLKILKMEKKKLLSVSQSRFLI